MEKMIGIFKKEAAIFSATVSKRNLLNITKKTEKGKGIQSFAL